MDGKEPEMEFNLLDEPWIIVKTKTNETKTWSILELFEHAHEAQELAGELPTQDIAIMRLLLAIMHGAFVTDEIETADDAIDLWTSMWEEKQFRFDEIKAYLEPYHDRFWLFHPTQPFYQSAHIKQNMDAYKAAKGKKVSSEIKWKTVARLVGDLFQSDNAPRLFPVRTGEAQNCLTYAEAARWLLHLNGFDDDSAKMPTPKGVGYLGQLGLIYAKGRNLFETLMLNFILVDERNEVFADNEENSKAYWEKPVCETIEREIPQPRAQKDLLTMQSRRIFLHREQGMVTGYLLTMGDYFAKDASLLNEVMTVWKRDDTRDFAPRRHQLESQMWRDLSSLLGMKIKNDDKARQPGIIHWLQLLEDAAEAIRFDVELFHICVTGASYDLKGAGWQIVDYVQDDLTINASLLAKMNEIWIQEIIDVLEKTKKAINSFGYFVTDIAEGSGDSMQKSNQIQKRELAKFAQEDGYYHLDQSFRRWLLCINPEKDNLEERTVEWLHIAKQTLLQLAQEELDRCSETAIVGRVKDGTVQNAIKSFREFQYRIKKALG
ncbi:type I-E CRISPR-associated protein Cse1/CasA [Mitsuokella jalaludinii]|uniref:type I-E CRISPR-associated protein Cse1/CasA n=1 Tax=Mitsuokella jalaludinii TaxID=187979 RepID=UPI00298CA319|nr:type I-E CRISPR-associated protein Cse1/CasA [Mitsuokella jalaludinii]